MKIDMYTLLGLVKDGKAPKKIKVYGKVYINNNCNCYLDEKDKSLCSNVEIPMFLNDTVEILEEEKKIPEKLYKYMEKEEEGCYENILRVYDGGEYEINEDMSFVIDKINSIIDYLKSKGE